MQNLAPFAAVLLIATSISARVVAAEYQGYIPKGMAEMGETWRGSDASQILTCKTTTSAKLHSLLSKEAAHSWYGMCANANKVHEALVAGDCLNGPATSACKVAFNADNAIRRDPEFWHVVNALGGRPDDYGLDD